MPRKKTLRRFFKGIKKMEETQNPIEEEVKNEEVIEQPQPEVSEPEASVSEVQPENEPESGDVEKKTSETCTSCNGLGMNEERTVLCSTCEGRGVI